MVIVSIPQEGKEPITYFMEDRLYENITKKIIPALHKRDKDRVLVVDGNEGSGKSTFALQIGKLVDHSLDLSRVCFNAEAFREAILKAKKGQCVVYDEAFTGLSSRQTLSGVNKVLVSLMMQMRQKNLMVIVVLPTIFMLDKYVALFRTVALLHVYECNGRRGFFKVYDRAAKRYLFIFGKQTFSYKNKWIKRSLRGRFRSDFVLGDDKVEEEYRAKKNQALMDTERVPITERQSKHMDQRNKAIIVMRESLGFTYQKISDLMKEQGINLPIETINGICIKYGKKSKEPPIYEEELSVPLQN